MSLFCLHRSLLTELYSSSMLLVPCSQWSNVTDLALCLQSSETYSYLWGRGDSLAPRYVGPGFHLPAVPQTTLSMSIASCVPLYGSPRLLESCSQLQEVFTWVLEPDCLVESTLLCDS